jgi:hypothetical protein
MSERIGIAAPPEAGKALAERLGLTIVGTEGHDLKAACIICQSSDALRVHKDKGVAQCYSCSRSWSPFDLAKTVLGDHQAAIQAMVDVGLFEDQGLGASNGNGQDVPTDSIGEIARLKGCTREEFLKYGAIAVGPYVQFPMYGPDGKQCSACRIPPSGGTGLYTKDKPVGLFLPHENGEVRLPEDLRQYDLPAERWGIPEGPKDAAALSDLGWLAAGLPGSSMNQKFAGLFRGVDVYIFADRDRAGEEGAKKTADVLQGVAKSIRFVTLPVEFKENHGLDVRDVLKLPDGREKLQEAIEQAEVIGKDKDNKTTGKIHFDQLTCAELVRADLKIEYLVNGLLVAGQPCIVAGPKKSLKTSLMLELSLSLACGGHFLGKFKVAKPIRVGLMTGESGLATVQETIRRICAAACYDPTKIDNLIITDRVPRFGNDAYDAALQEFITSNKLAVVTIDPAYMAMDGGDAGNLFVQGATLRSVNEICQKANCTLILVHHTRKNLTEPYGQPELEDIAWAGFQEFARQWLLINRREKYKPGTGSHKLWLSIGGTAGHGSLWGLDIEEGVAPSRFWNVSVLSPAGVQEALQSVKNQVKTERQEKQLGVDRMAIMQVMGEYPGGETKTAIREKTKISGSRFNRALENLVDDGTVITATIKKGNRKKPYEGYKLADADVALTTQH